MTIRVYDYETSDTLPGTPSLELIEASGAADPTGAVPAYRDGTGVWQYVKPSWVEHYRRNLLEEVRTVYVDE